MDKLDDLQDKLVFIGIKCKKIINDIFLAATIIKIYVWTLTFLVISNYMNYFICFYRVALAGARSNTLRDYILRYHLVLLYEKNKRKEKTPVYALYDDLSVPLCIAVEYER